MLSAPAGCMDYCEIVSYFLPFLKANQKAIHIFASQKHIFSMIQRIQTVFLLVAFIASILMFFYPIASYYGELNIISFYLHQLKDSVPDSQPLYNEYFLLPLLLVNLLIGAASVYAVLSFRTLDRQLKVIKFGIFATILMIAALFFFYADHISKTVQAPAQYEFGVFLPLISLVFLLLASRSVQRDIKLIRSVDRLR